MKNKSNQKNRPNGHRYTVKVQEGHVSFRIVCHASIVGLFIGRKGSGVESIYCQTGVSNIHCEGPVPFADHRVISVVGSSAVDRKIILHATAAEGVLECHVSCAQAALFMIFERLWMLLGKGNGDLDVCCELLADVSQMEAVNNIIFMMVSDDDDTTAKITVLPPPLCAAANDQLIQIIGVPLAARKALAAISCALQDNPMETQPIYSRPIDTSEAGYIFSSSAAFSTTLAGAANAHAFIPNSSTQTDAVSFKQLGAGVADPVTHSETEEKEAEDNASKPCIHKQKLESDEAIEIAVGFATGVDSAPSSLFGRTTAVSNGVPSGHAFNDQNNMEQLKAELAEANVKLHVVQKRQHIVESILAALFQEHGREIPAELAALIAFNDQNNMEQLKAEIADANPKLHVMQKRQSIVESVLAKFLQEEGREIPAEFAALTVTEAPDTQSGAVSCHFYQQLMLYRAKRFLREEKTEVRGLSLNGLITNNSLELVKIWDNSACTVVNSKRFLVKDKAEVQGLYWSGLKANNSLQLAKPKMTMLRAFLRSVSKDFQL
ncbi:hypothetical protein ACFE04_016384 [Oxalis oulophora]